MAERPPPADFHLMGERRDVEDIIDNHDPNYQPFPGIILRDEVDGQDYYILSPTNSEEVDAPARAQEEDRQAIIHRNIREFMRENRMRMAQHEANRERQPWELEIHPIVEVNNNGEFRNYNGYLSPSPSPPPRAINRFFNDPEEDDSWMYEPMVPQVVDPEVDILNVALEAMEPPQSRPRKRRNSDNDENTKRKRVTFKEGSSDELLNSLTENSEIPGFSKDMDIYVKKYDDDDEGFFGGPPGHFFSN